MAPMHKPDEAGADDIYSPADFEQERRDDELGWLARREAMAQELAKRHRRWSWGLIVLVAAIAGALALRACGPAQAGEPRCLVAMADGDPPDCVADIRAEIKALPPVMPPPIPNDPKVPMWTGGLY